ncbi:TorF family putative porin [Kordiimonas pumila]|uniref:TorF family putative porin n=1 Tax=Kordiimonas pumila TaxID=2161677 RepID=A0ABV7D3Y7_9PROT|nr:TorF family putative porin [Kordiimonas pumila]
MKHIIVAVAAIVCAAQTAFAADDTGGTWAFSGAVATDRIWRGVSQTRGNAAFMAEAKYIHSKGPFAGVWVSNLDYGVGTDTSLQADIFAGIDTPVWGRVNLEAAVLHQIRPSEQSLDVTEFKTSLTYGFKQGGWAAAGVFYSPNYHLGGESFYKYLSASVPLAQFRGVTVSASPHIGFYGFSGSDLEGYRDWKLGITAAKNGWYGSVNYTETNLNAQSVHTNSGFAGARFAATLTKVF